MGTTSDKLTYLATTKTKIKDAINLGDANITTETFRQYEKKIKQALINTMLDKWGIWDNFEKVTGTNTSLSLSPTSLAPISIDLKGDTQQDSTTGKNLLPITLTSQTKNGIVIKVNDDNSITFNNTATSGTTINLNYTSGKYIHLVSGETYTISIKNNSGLYIRLAKVSDNTNVAQFDTPNTSLTFTSNYTGDCFVYIAVLNNTTFNNLTIYPMVEKSSSVSEYEPYTNGASPNPDYPQEIHNVSGDNTINVCGKNLYNKDNITDGNYLTSTGGIGSSVNWSISDYIKVQANEKYTYQGITITGMNTYSCYYDSDKNFVSSFKIATGNREITIPDGISYVRFSISISDSHQDMNTFMLEKGETASTYEPYTGQSQLISLGVENLFDISTITTGKTINEGTGNVTTDASNRDTSDFIKVQPNTQYTCSTTMTRYAYYDENKTFKNFYTSGTTITTNSDTQYLRFSYDNSLTNIQFEKGTKKNSFTPYGVAPIELCKIGTYQDKIYKDNGKWYLHKEIGEAILNGSENYYEYSVSSSIMRYQVRTITDGLEREPIITNYFKYLGTQPGYSTIGCSFTTRVFFFVNKTDIPTTSDWQTWLSTHNTIVYYVLATPTNTEITDSTLISQLEAIKNMNSYNGTTNISQENNDEPFILDVSAIKEYE